MKYLLEYLNESLFDGDLTKRKTGILGDLIESLSSHKSVEDLDEESAKNLLISDRPIETIKVSNAAEFKNIARRIDSDHFYISFSCKHNIIIIAQGLIKNNKSQVAILNIPLYSNWKDLIRIFSVWDSDFNEFAITSIVTSYDGKLEFLEYPLTSYDLQAVHKLVK